MVEEIEHKTPLDFLIELEELNVPQNDRDILISFLTQTLHFILDQSTDRKDVVIYSILYALNDVMVNEQSARARSKDLEISHGLIPHYIKEYKTYMNFTL